MFSKLTFHISAFPRGEAVRVGVLEVLGLLADILLADGVVEGHAAALFALGVEAVHEVESVRHG